MNGLKKEGRRAVKAPVEIRRTSHAPQPALIVGWQTRDAGRCSLNVTDFLIRELEAEEAGEIKPWEFFSFGEVRFREDLIQVQESKLWVCKKLPLSIFKSDEPELDHYRFLNGLLDAAERHVQIKEIYTLSGMVGLTPHTLPRRIFSVFNQKGIKERLEGFGLEYLTWKGPPAISSYLLWVANRRGIPGISLWPEIPFYLSAREDPRSVKAVLSFFNDRFGLNLELERIEGEIKEQEEKLRRLRAEDPDSDRCLDRLEKGLPLEEGDQLALARKVYDVLKR